MGSTKTCAIPQLFCTSVLIRVMARGKGINQRGMRVSIMTEALGRPEDEKANLFRNSMSPISPIFDYIEKRLTGTSTKKQARVPGNGWK